MSSEYRVLESVTVNGRRIELRQLRANDATAYVVVTNGVYANFSSRSAAYSALDLVLSRATV